MKRKLEIKEKIDSLWEVYNSSVTEVAEMSWDKDCDKQVMNETFTKGLVAYKQLEILHWVLDNSPVD